jgi:hypothetical protein
MNSLIIYLKNPPDLKNELRIRNSGILLTAEPPPKNNKIVCLIIFSLNALSVIIPKQKDSRQFDLIPSAVSIQSVPGHDLAIFTICLNL